MKPRKFGLVLLLLLSTLCKGCSSGDSGAKVAVLLPLSGPDAVGFTQPLEWALQNIKNAGGKLSLVYFDTGKVNFNETIEKIAGDESIVAVIGPDSSAQALTGVAALVQAKKVVISPSATSADLYRAFSQERLFWRTAESDIAQAHILLTEAAAKGAKSVALITSSEPADSTYFDWVGFLASEIGMSVTDLIRYDQTAETCDASMTQALSKKPDVLLFDPATESTTVCAMTKWRASGSGARLLFTDDGENPNVVRTLGSAAEGMEGVGLAPDSNNGFEAAYTAHFKVADSPPFAANVYDALTLLAYGLARSKGAAGDALASAIADVVAARGKPTGWDAKGIAEALDAIRSGDLPDVSGATGPLTFDRMTPTELTVSTYERWKVHNGNIEIVDTISTDDARPGPNERSIFDTLASQALRTPLSGKPARTVTAKGKLWAVLIAVSSGWDNYRHQADVLAQYQLLRKNGVPDERIILVMADDIANNPQNPEPGVMRYVSGGENIHRDIKRDYALHQVSATGLLDILAGHRSATLPIVVDSIADDDIYLFIAGHGNQDGVYFGLTQPIPPRDRSLTILTPEILSRTISEMAVRGRYRRLFIAVESCESGTLGKGFNAPNALLVTAASAVESSMSANYDKMSQSWLADQFSYNLWLRFTQPSNQSLAQLLDGVYFGVKGSHVQIYGPQFGEDDDVQVSEFTIP